MIKLRGHIVSVLIILALITAGISPACKFISGKKSLIEVCTPEGLKKIAVPAEQTPFKPHHPKHQNHDQCQFCFAFAKVKVTNAYPVIVSAFTIESGQILPPSVSEYTPRRTFGIFSPRGPPASA